MKTFHLECPDDLADRLDELVRAGSVADPQQAMIQALRRFLDSHRPELVERAASLLLDAAPPGSKIILFGSYARGEARSDSDLDFLVVEPEVTDRRAEMVRLQHVVRSLPVSVDVLVTSSATFDEWRNTPGTVLHEASKDGRVFDAVH